MPPRVISACWLGRRPAASSCWGSDHPYGIFLNTIFSYLPLLLWLVTAPYGPAFAPQGRRRGEPCGRLGRHRPHGARNSRRFRHCIDDDPGRGGVVLRRQCLQLANAGLCGRSRPRRSGTVLQHAAGGRCLRRFPCRRPARERRTIAAAAAHRHRARHTLVRLLLAGFSLSVELPARARPVVRRRLLRAARSTPWRQAWCRSTRRWKTADASSACSAWRATACAPSAACRSGSSAA